ncbi:MAG TPA: rRNA pseudouridine synthase [Balneola sp.]|jgi:23S rRNA pseudouridine2605 synthase|nr:pseudouridine synthase [Bacteroidota bacterium]MAC06443.1 pseudouridine synthase [Balneola sp.]MAO78636.1 pseudouridine synthase [Balneola sp.]MBF63135.1 pseudouridine synthase [Balneola sp.]HAH51162.1 rRNA pseudouridine synthase [Balneola sp.]|tara:strand:+ start:37907 stop:38746 length:840 start_codon:yes stop_codon:yes gene_type:complete
MNKKSGRGPSRRKKESEKKKSGTSPNRVDQNYSQEEEIRINKFIAHAGLCSRREADQYITDGLVKVNGKTITEMGTKVRRQDVIEVNGQKIQLEPFVYLLLNKPKNTITTTDDEKGRNTVLDEVENATGARVYPVGRLDRNTTGLLILTNDGDLAHRLMHPSYSVRKTYEVETERILTDEELSMFKTGIPLEDGDAKGHNVKRFMDAPKIFQLSVFEGRNRLIRRMVEHFGTEVTKLKRIEYAGLNLKGVKVGRWRYLRQKEVNNIRELVKLETLDFKK